MPWAQILPPTTAQQKTIRETESGLTLNFLVYNMGAIEYLFQGRWGLSGGVEYTWRLSSRHDCSFLLLLLRQKKLVALGL